ncbi:cubilin-like [Lineus longissimus]|uniref:cubilin-like n=1 Tax=Lineus longissimus TaxID=88925 RepID=UPI002B4D0343
MTMSFSPGMARLRLLLLIVMIAAMTEQSTGRVLGLGSNEVNCNLTLKGPEGKAMSPANMPANETCVWQFLVTKDDHVYFMFNEFSLLPGDVLFVYKNETLDELVGNFTGRLDPFVVVTFSKNTTMVLKSGPEKSKNGMRRVSLNFSIKACTIKLTNPGQVVMSPVYLPTGKGYIICNYHIDVTKNAARVLTLSFTQFDLVKGTVIVYDGNDKKTAKMLDSYTASNASSVTDSIANGTSVIVEMMFSLSPKKRQNIQASAALVDAECSGKVMAPIVLRSPGYPLAYKSGLDCRWIVLGPNGTTLLANMTKLSLGDGFDYVAVNDHASRSGQNLVTYRSGAPRPLAGSSRNGMWIRFFSDESQSGTGFVLNITLQGYGGSFYKPTGTIGWGLPASPYNNTVEKYWIRAPEHMQVLLKINNAKMFPMSSITCYSGETPAGAVVASFRTNAPFYTAFSDSNKMFVVARGFNGSQYFRGTYRAVAKGSYLNLQGQDGSVSVMSSMVNRSMVVLSKQPELNSADSFIISLGSMKFGQNDTLTVFNGLSAQDMPLFKYNRSALFDATSQNIRVSAGKGFRLQFARVSKNVASRQLGVKDKTIFKMMYTASDNVCAQPTPGVITSPNYPLSYPINGYCQKNITVPTGELLHLSFDTVTLLQSHSLKIFSNGSGSKPYLTLNGSQLHDDIILNTRSINVQFAAPVFKSGIKVGKGFNLTYEITDCGSIIDLKDGTKGDNLQTPRYPQVMKNKTTCVWLIKTKSLGKAKGSVNVISYTYSFAGLNNNSDNYVYLYDGGSSLSEVRPINMSNPQGKTSMISASNKMIVRYVFNPNSEKHRGFAFKMAVQVHECTKENQCANGKCLLPAWRCDGIDQCGDMSDEKDCTKITDKYVGVPTWGFALAIIAALAVGALIAVVGPCIYKRARHPNYRELRDLMAPVPT